MRMKKTTLLIAAAAFLVASSASATPITLNTTGSTSTFMVTVDGGPLNGPSGCIATGTCHPGVGTGVISGSLSSDVNFGTGEITNVTSSFSVSNFALAPASTLGTITFEGFGFADTGPATPLTVGSGGSVDIGGSTLSVNAGFVKLNGSALFDFSATPLNVTLPAGTTGTFGVSGANISFSLPFTTVSTLSTFGIPVNITIDTALNLSGVVPEPGTALLIGAGLAGLALAGHRKAA